MSRLHSHGLQLDPERTLDRLADLRIIEAENNREMPDGGDAAQPHGASRPPLIPLVNLPDGLPLAAPIKSQPDFVLVSEQSTQHTRSRRLISHWSVRDTLVELKTILA